MKISFREIANRITGFDIPVVGGGLSWNPPTLDIEVAKRLTTFLEDRRALYYPYEAETPDYVVRSILEIRQRLTKDLEQLDRNSPLAKSLRAMRASCRKFLNHVEARTPHAVYLHRNRIWNGDEADFFIALGELRATIGFLAAQIAARYEIDVEESLATIFPEPLEKEVG